MTKSISSRQPESPDRRRAPRVSCRRPLHVVSGRDVWTAEAQDISEGGIRLGRSERPLPGQGRLQIFISLPTPEGPGSSLCLLEGEIVWANEEQAGLRLVDVAEEHRACLRGLVR